MNRSFQSVVIAFFASILLISGCSSGSSTGVSFSKEAVTEEQCFAEYVSFYGDLQDEFLLNKNVANQALFDISFGDLYSDYDYDLWSSGNYRSDVSRFGQDHYRQTGAKEGRQLPYGCERFLRPDPRCFDSYFRQDSNADIWGVHAPFSFASPAISEMEEIHGVRATPPSSDLKVAAAMGYAHWIDYGREEGRPVPEEVFGSSPTEILRCQGMITHQPACRPGNRFPNCDATSSQDLGAPGVVVAALAAAVDARAAECAATGGTINNDTGVCTPAPAPVICDDGWDEEGNAC